MQDERMEMTDKALPGLIVLKMHVLKEWKFNCMQSFKQIIS